ncbi:MAG: AAA family ATPase [Acidimicrobiaceae bacterium]|nr:AAA family ATPase [Acidimicrobiaceae bacterium]MYE75938.1 AAA family ATPase [Acidimicrobiaceae bacterium]MYH43062.1 AAA family ATPase [Acidimicrobiaceae bacterium]MYJ42510.1 AAA family ATPase [Acidimicrobiaceae bacterium]MYJ82355.1 AAA family ATPase [Acidimicrobiaceae bacterium]
MDRLANPYRPGAGTQPAALVGRDVMIDDFGVTLRRALDSRPGKSCMLLGLRGTGKTVLLNRFMEIADQEGARTAFVEASDSGSFSQLLAIRLRRVLLQLAEGPVRRAATRALRVLRSFALHLPDGSAISVGVDPAPGLADSGVLSEDLADLLVAAGEAAADGGSGIVLAVDEAQYLRGDEMGATIGAIHRTTQLNLPVVLVAAGLPQLRALAGQARTYTERLFAFPEVGALTPDEARDALVLPAEAQRARFEPQAIDSVVAESRGYPYFVQEWGYHAWNAAPGDLITLHDVNAASRSVTDTLDRDFFRVRFDRLTPKERVYLRAMAELGPGPHRSGDIATELGVRVQSVAPRRSALIAKGMIYSPAHGDTAFTVPLFDDFLRRTLPR